MNSMHFNCSTQTSLIRAALYVSVKNAHQSGFSDQNYIQEQLDTSYFHRFCILKLFTRENVL